MSEDEFLETPPSYDDLYMARGDEVEPLRPVFTGDVFEHPEGLLMLVQHPCALRRGAYLHPRLLVVEVEEGVVRSKWTKQAYTEMPLPDLFGDGKNYVAKFINVQVVDSDSLDPEIRVATLSQLGVNLLLQRWVYHNTRVAIKTSTYDDQTFGPFNEAELLEDWMGEFPAKEDALLEFDKWIRDGNPSKQDKLKNTQSASGVRREMREYLKKLKKITALNSEQ